MPSLSHLRRAPWLTGAVLLLVAAAPLLPLARHFGRRYWPFYAGLAALLLLLLGWLERRWQGRPLPGRFRVAERKIARSRFRVVPGGKGNGHDRDGSEGGEGDKPRWLM